MSTQKTVKIFTMEKQFPCGPQSSCCGSIGQDEQEVSSLKKAIEDLGLAVQVYDMQKMKNPQDNPQVFKLLSTFGNKIVPVITINDEVTCMGQSATDDVISAIKSKL